MTVTAGRSCCCGYLTTGAPTCLAPLMAMIPYPHKEPRFRYAIAYAAVKCGGTKSFVEVVKALPDSGTYAKDDLNGSVSGEIERVSDVLLVGRWISRSIPQL